MPARLVLADTASVILPSRGFALPTPTDPEMSAAPVVVVGAGVTGLALAWQLQRMGQSCVVLEAGERAGGAVRSENRDGFWLEWGPSTLRGALPELGWLLEQLTLRDRVVPMTRATRQRYVVDPDGRWRKLGSGLLPSLLGQTPGRLWHAGRMLARQPWNHPERVDEDQSFYQWVHASFGPFAADVLAQGFCHGLYGADADQLDARFVLAQPERVRPTPVGQRELPRTFWLQGGVQSLTDALGDVCQVRVCSSLSLPEIIESFRPAGVVLAGSWQSACALLAQLDIEARVDVVPPSSMHLHYLAWAEAPWSDGPTGVRLNGSLGAVCASTQARVLGLHAVSTTTPERVPARAGLVALYCRAGTSADQALEEFRTQTGIGRAPDTLWSSPVAHPMPAPRPGFMAELDALRQRLTERPGTPPLWLAGSYAGAVGLPGRVRSALHIADAVLRHVQNHT